MIDNDRLKHSYAVGKKMIEIGKQYKLSEFELQELFVLGLNHDIGYEFGNNSNHNVVGGKILKENNASKEVLDMLVSPQSAAQGIGAAVENFLLAATEMGYGTCYMTGPTHAKAELEELIGFEKPGFELMSMIALGVAADETPAKPPRKPLEDVVTFID